MVAQLFRKKNLILSSFLFLEVGLSGLLCDLDVGREEAFLIPIDFNTPRLSDGFVLSSTLSSSQESSKAEGADPCGCISVKCVALTSKRRRNSKF